LAINWLQRCEGKNAVEPLREFLLRTKNEEIYLKVLEALVALQQKEVVPYLWKELDNETLRVRAYSAKMLGSLGDATTVRRLIKALKLEQDLGVRQEIETALSKLDKKPRSFIEKLFGRRNWVREH
jgi:HEAT repeat protein